MTPAGRRSRLLAAALAAGAVAIAIVAVPVLGQGAQAPAGAAVVPAASGSPDPSPGTQKAEEKPGKGPKADKGPKAEKVPETPVTLQGTVGTKADEDGGTEYTLTVNGTVYELEAGPPWYWGENHPLKGLVGKTVTIEGDQEQGSTSIDVRVADGKTLREPGKPPWAGGWKVQGEKHPGWAQWKVDKADAKAKAQAEKGNGPPPWAGPKSPEPSPGG
jgi:hypothetical protein